MALNGAGWASYAGALGEFLAGATPDELVPVTLSGNGGLTVTGAGVPFVHAGAKESAAVGENGLVREGTLTVFVATAPRVGALFTHRGFTWQVAEADVDRAAGADWPIRVKLVRHAS
jgi:hypothetical protein